MEWSTHALSGVLAGYLATGGDWKGAAVGSIAGVIPDLDEPKSKFGKVIFPISLPVNKIFGHRTLTHSLLFAVILSAILYPFTQKWIWLATLVGLLAHVAGDMLTGTVKFLYPSKKSVGIRIHPSQFKLIDSTSKALLLVGLFVVIVPSLL
ncbi:metal-dependent hydrolase [Lentibacillus sp. N15]|uniref:metal-dependent hydrolase n=1 Tax=Lentibacillus songyuanensis TaxID=3136161 RepID=UPI0031BB2C1B